MTGVLAPLTTPPLALLAVAVSFALTAGVAALSGPAPAPAAAPAPGRVPGVAPATVSAAQQVAAAPAWLRPELLAAAAASGLPAALLTAIARVESSFDPLAVGPPVPGGPALGLMQFLPSSWTLFNRVPGATPFDPGPALLAAGAHLLASGAQPGGRWDARAALFGYNHSWAYVAEVLAVAAGYGWSPGAPR